ncbi:MAG: Pr6Pr family membrane protein [Eubacteriales bacterium]|nr:Pr6Pr family membrane protein [Eubacteriales bacterium]MDD4105229.1 Pr6Pr family membrane protein [Eubacteriales bacterium]MDD4710716.1 Pr6Pr family membrane protein [Eubacteriales bacterium]NLO15399.1 Pr6Pr family membrane protein [Clostridiales bacterium]
MRIKSRPLSVLFKLLLCAAATLGVLIQIGVFTGVIRWSVLNYYTLMSNVLCALYFFPAMLHESKGRDTLLPILKGAVVTGITITGLIYHFVLAGSFEMQGTLSLSNFLLHYVVPLMAVTDWLLFSSKGNYRFTSPFMWLLLPDGYFLYAVIRVALGATLGYDGNRYPYPFLNADALGWGRVIANGLALNLFFLVLGFLFVIVDRLMARNGALSKPNA